MTISVLQEVGAEDTSAGTSLGVAITCTAGSSLHIIVTHGLTGSFNMAATPLTNTGTGITFSAALDNINDAVNAQRVVHYKADGVPGQTTTITGNFTGAASFRGIKVKEIAGTSGYDATASAHAGQAQTSPTTGANATTSGNTPALTSQPALISGVTTSTASATTNAVGTGFTTDQTAGSQWQFGTGVTMSASESKRVTATSALAATFTAAANDTRLTVAAVFLESGGGGGGGGGTFDNELQLLASRRNRPGRGPYSVGRYFRPRVDAWTPVAGAQSFSYSAVGGLTLGGASARISVRTTSSAGGLTLGGAATLSRAVTRSVAGGLVVAGAAAFAKGATVVPAGGVTLAGLAAQIRARVPAPAGGLNVAGAATVSTSGSQQFSYTAAGGLSLAGLATLARVSALAAAGGLQLGGSASMSAHEAVRTVSASGGLHLGGAANGSGQTVGGGGAGGDIIRKRRLPR